MLEMLGQYRILDRIGSGRLGGVYRARDTRLGRTVAVRVLATEIVDRPERRELVLREARAATALSHPNIAALYEIGEEQGYVFLASEFVPGGTLTSVIAGRPLNARRAVDLGAQIADGLAAAHADGIVHGRVEPDNVIVTPKGAAKLLDCGVAAATGPTPEATAYMSPEQARGDRVDYRTDIFSAGVVLFEMLTGQLPFGGSRGQVADRPALAAQPAPSAVNSSLPRELDAIVAKALAGPTGERYESAATLAAELRSVGAMLDARRQDVDPSAWRRASRHGLRGRFSLVVIGGALLVAAISWWKKC